jgi:hypothetical protein
MFRESAGSIKKGFNLNVNHERQTNEGGFSVGVWSGKRPSELLEGNCGLSGSRGAHGATLGETGRPASLSTISRDGRHGLGIQA